MARLLALAAVVASTAACSASAQQPPPYTPTARPSAGTTAPPAGSTQKATLEPLVLAIHATRAAQDIDLATARTLISGHKTAWRGFRLTPVAATTGGAAGALRRVERDTKLLAIVPASVVGPSVRAVTVAGVDPLREPVRYPLTTAGQAPAGPVVDLTVGGDVMLGRRVGAAAARAGDVSSPLRSIGPRLAAADITVLNLESTLSRAGSAQQGGDSFAAPEGVLAGLRSAGVDVLSLANNHTGDFESDALVETVDRARAAGIQPVGAGRNLAEASRSVMVTRDGVRFGFLAFNAIGETPRATATQPGALSVRMPPRTGPLNSADLRALSRSVETLRRQVDVVVVLPHWGQQYTHKPVPAQRTVAGALLRAGAELVAGGHPHWVQGVDVRGSRLVAHSLGNLVFDMDFSRQTQEGVLLELTYWGSKLKAARLTPYVIGADFTPRLVTGARAERILAAIRSESTFG